MTQIFPPTSDARVMTLPPGADFAVQFLKGLRKRMEGQPPEVWAQTEIWVNIERTRRRLTDLLEASPVQLMPRIKVFTDLTGELQSTAPVTSLRRQLELSQLVRKLIIAEPNLAAPSAAFDLAGTLGDLVSEMQTEGITWDELESIDHAALSGHWQRSLKFLQLIRPVLDADGDNADAQLRNAVMTRIANWSETPPSHPVIIAGSTGSRGAIALFMQAVARLPQGAVVLPGFDAHLTSEVWRGLNATGAQIDHPQYRFAALADLIGFDPQNLQEWQQDMPPNLARNAVTSLAMRPAPVTDQWLRDGPALAHTLPDAMAKVSLIEADTQRTEALSIATRMRVALEDGQRAALITPDRVLARRVAAFLDRWNIAPDDSAGRPLALTPPGVFLQLVLAMIGQQPTPANLLALLKHPLTASGGDQRGMHLGFVRKLELTHLRGGAPFLGWQALNVWAEKYDAATWVSWWAALLRPVANDLDTAPLPDRVEAHITLAEALAAGPGETGSGGLWDKDAGQIARQTIAGLQGDAEYGGAPSLSEYRSLFKSVLVGADVPDAPYTPHPDAAILGTLEARTQAADLVILGSLNEGSWPRIPRPDPWLNRDMRGKMGLPLPEQQIGLSAHDFQQAMGAREVVLSRATRDAEAPTVASRWLMRLTNLLGGLGADGKSALSAMRTRGAELIALSETIERPTMLVPPAPRPAPCPPLAARPQKLAVTRIEALVRDPYAIYAQYILNLRALRPLGRDPDARERGTANHKVLQQFIETTSDALPENAADIFDQTARDILHSDVPWPATRVLWFARLMGLRDWFLAGEKERRLIAQPMQQEARGGVELTETPLPFRLEATADRIDLTATGGVAIYDYKGALPSKKQVENFSLQLPLEGAIAARGGFKDIAAARPEHLELIGLSSAGKSLVLDTPEESSAAAWARLNELISAYQVITQPYVARFRTEMIKFEGDYDHLSRLGEWADGDGYLREDLE